MNTKTRHTFIMTTSNFYLFDKSNYLLTKCFTFPWCKRPGHFRTLYMVQAIQPAHNTSAWCQCKLTGTHLSGSVDVVIVLFQFLLQDLWDGYLNMCVSSLKNRQRNRGTSQTNALDKWVSIKFITAMSHEVQHS